MKNNLKRFLAALLATVMLLGVSASFAETAEVTVPAADAVLATVNGQSITYGDAEYYINYLLTQYSDTYGIDLSDPELIGFCRGAGLDYAIQYALLDQIGEELSVALTDEEKAQIEADTLADWKNIVDYFCADMFGISEESTEEEKNAAVVSALATLESNYGYTEAGYVQEALDYAKYEKVQAAICADVKVTDEDIKAAFDEKVAADKEQYGVEGGVSNYEMMQMYGSYYGIDSFYYIPEGYRAVDQILLAVDETLLNTYKELSSRLEEQAAADTESETATTEAPVTPEQVAEALNAILASIEPTVKEINDKYASGVSFDELIDEYNTDPGMMDPATRAEGYAVHAESVMFDPAFTAAAMSLEKIGDISAPSVGSYGAYLVYYLRDIPGGAVEMTDEIKADLMEELQSDKEVAAMNSYVEAKRASSDIQYTELGQSFMAAMEGTGETTETIETTETAETPAE